MPEHCPICGSVVIAPGIKARNNGYKSHYHCQIWANQRGHNARCWSLWKHGVYGLCDTRYPMCPVHSKWVVERPVGIGGRVQEVFKDGPYDRNPAAEKHQQFATCLLLNWL